MEAIETPGSPLSSPSFKLTFLGTLSRCLIRFQVALVNMEDIGLPSASWISKLVSRLSPTPLFRMAPLLSASHL